MRCQVQILRTTVLRYVGAFLEMETLPTISWSIRRDGFDLSRIDESTIFDSIVLIVRVEALPILHTQFPFSDHPL